MDTKKFLDLDGLSQFKSKILSLLNNKVDKNQGIDNAGKTLKINDNGNIEAADPITKTSSLINDSGYVVSTSITKILKITQSEYDALTTPSSSTLYIIEA